MNRAERVASLAITAEAWVRHLLALIMVFLVALNLVALVGRHFPWYTLSWADEVMTFAMVWGVALGLFSVSLRKAHLSMDLLFISLPRGARRVLEVLIATVTIGVTGFVMLQSWRFIQAMAQVDMRSMAAQMPMAIPHSALLIGFGLIIIAMLVRLYLTLAGIDLSSRFQHEEKGGK